MDFLKKLFVCMIVLTQVGRAPELFPALAPLRLGLLTLAGSFLIASTFGFSKMTALLRETPVGKWILILIVLIIVGMPLSIWPFGAYLGAKSYLQTVIVSCLLLTLAREQDITVFWYGIIGTVIMVAGLMVLGGGSGSRVDFGGSYDPNDLALLFVMYLPLVLVEGIKSKLIPRILSWTAALCAVMGVALTQSRGALIALVAMGCHALLFVKKGRMALICVAGIGAVALALTADDSFWDRFRSLQEGEDYNLEGEGGRVAIWTQGIGFMLSNPLTGLGIAQFSTATSSTGSRLGLTAHNSYVQIGAELGVVGLVVFLGLLKSVHTVSKLGVQSPHLTEKEKLRFRSLTFSLTAFCVGGFFLSQAYGLIPYSLFTLAATMYLQLREKETRAASLHTREQEASEEPLEAPAATPEALVEQAGWQRSSHNRVTEAEVRRLRRIHMLRAGDRRYTAPQGEEKDNS